jgi:phosphatidylinositol alpha-mannosyltransferase
MRIALTHAFCWPEVRRGAERFIQELGAALVERDHEVTILSAAWEPTTSELDGVTTVRLKRRREGVREHEADFGRRVLPRLITGRFDAVHSMGRRDAVASIRASRLHPGRRTVITDLGIPLRSWWESVGPREARAVERVVRGIDVYSCMSQWALDHLSRDYGRADGVVVPGGVRLDSFTPAPTRSAEPTLLFSGALDEPRKGLATLLDALPHIAEVEPGVRLRLSGPGDPTPFLASAPPEAVARTEVLDAGAPDDQQARYGTAWATCLPSVSDSFGMVLVESLACGTPIVVTTDGAPKELVDVGVTGAMCEPHDAAGLTRACLDAIALARDGGTVERCRASVRRFDWREGIAPHVERLYRGERSAAFTAPVGGT